MTELGFPAIRVGDSAISAITSDSVVVADLGRSAVEENLEIVTNYRVATGYEEGKTRGWKKEG